MQTANIEQLTIKKGGRNIKLKSKLGSGSFGEVFKGFDAINKMNVAVKLEKANVENPYLKIEAKFYQQLSGGQSVTDNGIPNMYCIDKEGGYNVMVMDLLGPSLQSQFQLCNQKFGLKTVLMLADQMIQRIEYVHSKQILHRDIKPDNFVLGLGKQAHKVFIVDFGLAKKYIQKDGQHIPYKDGKNLIGTSRYASTNMHLGMEKSCRDDLEELGYVLLYFLLGKLPWQGIKAKNQTERNNLVGEKKLTTSVSSLCKGLPIEFEQYITYCKTLKFDEKPNYSYLRDLFKELLKNMQQENDYVYDWSVKEKENQKNEQKQENVQNEQKQENLLNEQKEQNAKNQYKEDGIKTNLFLMKKNSSKLRNY